MKRSLSLLTGVLTSIALVRGLASCAEGAPKAEENDAGSTPDADPGHPLQPPDGGGTGRCEAGAWCAVDLGSAPVSLNGVWGSSATDVWIAGSPDTILHWDGKDLARSKTETRQTLFGVWGSGPGDVWAYSTGESIWHSDGFHDGGVVWSTLDGGAGTDDPVFTGVVASMWGRNANDVWAVGPFSFSTGTSSVWHSNGWTESGPSWSAINTSTSDPPFPEPISWSAIWGSGGGELWLVGAGGKTRHAKDVAGENVGSWEAVNSNTSHDLFAVWGSGTDVWAAGAGGTMRRFSRDVDGSVLVTEVVLPTTETIQSIFGFGPNDIWAAGTGATLLHWDGGEWSVVDVPVDPPQRSERDLYSIWGSSPDDLWVVGRNVLLHKGSADLPGRSK